MLFYYIYDIFKRSFLTAARIPFLWEVAHKIIIIEIDQPPLKPAHWAVIEIGANENRPAIISRKHGKR